MREIKKKGSHISVTCPHHSEGLEKENSCGIYIGSDSEKYGHFNCFTCGEHGDFIHFVALCFDWPDSQAKKWLVDHYGTLTHEYNLDLEPIDLSDKQDTKYLDEKILDSYQSYHPYMDKRKLSKKGC